MYVLYRSTTFIVVHEAPFVHCADSTVCVLCSAVSQLCKKVLLVCCAQNADYVEQEVVAFSSLARISEECLTIHSPSALFFFF